MVYYADFNPIRRNYMKKGYLLILSLCFFFYNCVVSVHRGYSIHLYDENNILITDENKLKEFDVSFFDNSNIKAYKDVDFHLTKVGRDDEEMYEWVLHFYVGFGHQEYQARNLSNKFKDASEYMGIKIEDKKGRYKPVTIYSLGACSKVQVFEPIIVKLEKK